jgi:hypothetical protein
MSKYRDAITDDPMARQFLKYVEEATKEETLKIMKKYQEQMNADLEAVRAKIVAQAGVRLSSVLSIQDLGRTIRIEIVKTET